MKSGFVEDVHARLGHGRCFGFLTAIDPEVSILVGTDEGADVVVACEFIGQDAPGYYFGAQGILLAALVPRHVEFEVARLGDLVRDVGGKELLGELDGAGECFTG